MSVCVIPVHTYTGCKVICYVEKILELLGSQCRECSLQCEVTSKKVGCALVLKMKCSAGHVFTWCSSPTVTNANQHEIYKINMDFSSAVLFSGNNYYKIRQFCRFISVEVLSPSTYFSYQRLCLCPVISDYYNRKMVR